MANKETVVAKADLTIIGHKDMAKALKTASNAETPVCFVGPPGIGKTYGIREYAKAEAQAQGREFKDWAVLSKEERRALVQDTKEREKAYVLFELIMSSIGLGDLGIPDLHSEYTTWKIPQPLEVLCREQASGMLFLDELGQADPDQQKWSMRILQQKQVFDRTLAPKVQITAATNRSTHLAGSTELLATVRNRMAMCELKPPSVKEWTAWAQRNGLDGRVEQFLGLNMGSLYEAPKEGAGQFCTPRSWEYVARALDRVKRPSGSSDMEKYLDEIEETVGFYVGPATAALMRAMEKTSVGIDLESLYKDPEAWTSRINDTELKWLAATSARYHFKDHMESEKEVISTTHQWIRVLETVAPVKNSSTRSSADSNLFTLMLRGFDSELKKGSKDLAVRTGGIMNYVNKISRESGRREVDPVRLEVFQKISDIGELMR